MNRVGSHMSSADAFGLCVVGPGRHSPVLGAITEHIMSVLGPTWEISNVQVGVPGDHFDSTLIGMNNPALVSVPCLMETAAQSMTSHARRVERFLIRERPRAVLFELWSVEQADFLAMLVRVAHRLNVPVAVRCAGRLDESPRRGVTKRLVEALEDSDLVISCGYMPPVLASADCAWWSLPEWKTEERQADPDHVAALAFLPASDSGELDSLLRAFDGLTEARARRYRLHVLRYSDDDEPDFVDSVKLAHHADRIHLATHWLSDTELERLVQQAGVVVIFDPDETSRAVDAATFHGTPIVMVRGFEGQDGADFYCGATVCDREPASILVGIERANLARKFRYPQPGDWQRGAWRLSDRLATLVDGLVRERQSTTSGV